MYGTPMAEEVMYVLKCGTVALAWIIGVAMVEDCPYTWFIKFDIVASTPMVPVLKL
jgi:hypothetical protein